MRLRDFVGELAAGAALLLFVPMAVLIVGTPIVLVVRLIGSLFEGF